MSGTDTSSSITIDAKVVATVEPHVIVEPVSPELRNADSQPVVGFIHDKSADSVHDAGSVTKGATVLHHTVPIHRFAVSAACVPENVVPTLPSKIGAGVVPAVPDD
jgi:hypothetical protein